MLRFCNFKTLVIASFLISAFFTISGYPQETITAHFCIFYSTSGVNAATDDYVNKVATIAEECWSYIISQGFKRPPGVPETDPITDPEKKVQLIIMDLSTRGVYGDCSIVGKNSSTPPTIRVDNNYLASEYPTWNGDNALRTTLIHEFFHAVQQSYANKVSFSPIL